MKKAVVLLFVLIVAQMGTVLMSAAAQPAAQPAAQAPKGPVKIGFVNTLAILQGTAEGKQELTQMEAYRQEKQQAIQTQSEELQALRQQYDSQARMLNPDTAAEMEREISAKDVQVRRMQEDFEMDLNRRQSELLNRMSQKIQSLIAEYAEQNGFGAIFLQNPSLPYFSPALDITADIIKIYDDRHPVVAAAAPAPSQNP